MRKKIISFLLIILIAWPFSTNFLCCAENSENVVPTAMATDDNYILPTIVTITSIMENSKSTTKYDYYIMLSGEVSKENKQKLISIQEHYKNCSINLIDMKDAFKNAYISHHIKVPAYYRLSLPSLLPNIDKILYLDVDIIVNKDLFELYKTNINNYYLAGIKNPHGYLCKDSNFDYAKFLGIDSIDQYINSGVTLFNLKKMREDNLEQKFIDFITAKQKAGEAIPLHDQDTLNAVCYNHIYHLPCKYNLMLHYAVKSVEDFDNNKWLSQCYNRDEWLEAFNDPVIIHYSSWKKPWKKGFTKMYMADKWWEYAKKTPYLQEIKDLSKPK